MADTRSSTIVDVLRRRAAEHPDRPAYTFLANGEHPAAALTYAGLDRRARAVAAALRERWPAGTPVLMAYSPGLEFAEAFWGCLYARLIAVPAYPPRSGAHAPPRLLSIRDDCGPAGVLTTTEHLESLGEAIPGLPALATEAVPDHAGDGWAGTDPRGGDVALLQYSSGSTATPKGIVVSHRNIFANQEMVEVGFRHDERSTFVGWLPFFHDMGLFGNIIHPLFIGASSILMSPLAFLQKPARWLRAVSEYRAHTAGGPDFGYEHCVRRATPEEMEGVDLRSWKRAFNGAEKPRPETIRRFTERFGPYGFREEAFYPCYGLAEAVLFVTGRDTAARPEIRLSTPDPDPAGGAALGSRTARAAEHVSSGCSWLEQRVAIVDPETRVPRPEGREGEVWIAGPNVAEGYWRNPALTGEVFRARLADGDGPFLRTGDVGFMRGGELFVTGRLKDLVILRGQNHHPEDIEAAVEGCHPLVGPGQCAAVGVDLEAADGTAREALVVLVELPKPLPPEPELDALVERAAAAVSLRFGIAIGRLVLLPRGSIPKTSSGKVQRHASRRMLVAGAFAPVRVVDFAAGEDEAQAPEAVRAALAAASGPERAALLRDALARRLRALRPASAADGDAADGSDDGATAALPAAGLDSLRVVELAQWIEAACGVSLSAADLFALPSAGSLAESIEARLAAGAGGADEADGHAGAAEAEDGALSLGEAALLYEHEKDPAGSAYNLAFALRLTGALERERLERAVAALPRRHPHLRSAYVRGADGFRREIRDGAPLPLAFVDASAWAPEERAARIALEAERPFALDQGGVRFAAYLLGPRESVLLVAVHHVLVDLASAEVVLRDLAALYRDDGRAGEDRAPAAGYADFVRWQRRALASPRAEEGLGFWRGALAECHRPPRLPLHRRAGAAGGSGGVHRFRVGPEETAAVAALAAEERATPYMVLLAAYAVLLARFAGEDRFVVGTSAAGRPSARFAGSVGYFANILPLAVSVPPGASFRRVLGEVRERVARALDHQHLPYPLLVERLGPELGMEREGPVRHALTYGRGRHGDAFLSLLGEDPAARVPFGPLEAAGFPLGRQTAPFDLTLLVLERDGAMDAAFTYAMERVEAEAVPVMAAAFARLLPLLARNADLPLSRLALDPAPDTHPLAPPAPSTAVASEPGAPAPDPAKAAVSGAETPDGDAAGAGEPALRRFERQARARPDAVALRRGDRCVTYGELDRRAARLAAHLRGRGVGPESIVAVHCPRGTELVVAVLGILKAGGAYLPVDAAHPAERLRMVMEDAGARLVVTVSDLRGRAGEGAQAVALDEDGWGAGAAGPPAWTPAPAPGQLAYVIYTSGSTGRPKGVGVTHANLAGLLDGTRRLFDFGPRDGWVLFHSPAFDFSVWELWGALAHGGALLLPDPETTRDPARFAAELAERQVTVLNQTPSALYNLLPVLGGLRGGAAPPLRCVVLGGEAVRLEALEPWFRHPLSARARLVNMYGITEITVHATFLEVGSARAPGAGSAVGRGLDGVSARITGPGREPLPAWAVGEIAVGGAGVARGYLSRPALTARRFVPDPASPRPGARMYLSGDLGYARADGSVAYLGRADQQVKVRGHRIEPGEVEARLRGCAGVEWAAVLPDEGPAGSASLTAYLTGAPGLTVAELRRDLLRVLPEYMVPARFARVPSVPTTVNGKVDEARLRALGEPLESGTDYVAPATPAERTLARIWAEVLERDRVGAEDNYFVLGGDSIRSIQVISRAREAGLPLELATLLRGQTVRSVAHALGGAAAPAAAEWAGPFELVAPDDRRALPEGLEDAYPADRLLQGLLFHSQYSDDYQVYVTSFHVRAPWRPEAMEEALAAVVRRHPFLRSAVRPGPSGEPLQMVWREARAPLSFHDLRGVDEAGRERAVAGWIDREKVRGFDWGRAPLMEVAVHRRSDDSFQVTLREPYLDGWCVALFFRELFERYLALCAGSPPPSEAPTRVSQRHFVQLEREALLGEAARAFWTRRLDGAPASLVARGPRRRSREPHGRRTEVVPAGVLERLRAAAERAGVPLKTVLLAAHARLLSVLLGADEVLFGVVLNGRPEEGDGDRVIGSFLNTVPLRVRVAPGESWRSLARRIFAEETEAAPHRRFPLAEMRRLPSPPRFDTVFNFTYFHALEGLSGHGGFQILDAFATEQTFFPLTLHFNRSILTGELELLLDYDATRLSAPEIARLAEGALDLLHDVAADAEAEGGVGRAGRRLAGRFFPAPAGARPPLPSAPPLLSALDRHAAERPDAPALVGADRAFTWRGLRDAVDALAAHLAAELGVGPEERVALHAGRSAETIVALLAVLRAGGAYLPFDAAGPAERVDFLLRDARPRCVLAERAALPRLDGHGAPVVELEGLLAAAALRRRRPRKGPALDESLAYVMYTSGSTGRPKGVGVTRGAMAALAAAAVREYGIRPDDRVLQFSTLEFDISVEEVMMALEAGAALVLRPPTLLEGYDRFQGHCAAHGVTVLDLPTGFWRDWVREMGATGRGPAPSVRLAVIGGEAMDADSLRGWKEAAPGVALVNGYGPTEATVVASRAWAHGGPEPDVAPGFADSPIGTPFGWATAAVADERGRPLPPEVPGELLLGGSGVARGYLGRPALTAERFVPDPAGAFPGARRYRTGDVGYRAADGTLHYVGRTDHQVKVRGFRVELGEVEAALARCRGVRRAAVTADSSSGRTVLHAFVAADGRADDVEGWEAGLRRELEATLPGYMVPARFHRLDELPATPSGKVDRRALERMAARARAAAARPSAEAPDPLREVVLGIFRHALGDARPGPDDDFFALGGESLLAMRVAARLREALGCDLPVRDLFEHPRLGDLVEHVRARLAAGGAEPPAPLPPADGAPALSSAQERLWMAEHLSLAAAAYNIPAAVVVRGPLNPFALAQGLREVQRRHQVLRTRIELRERRLAAVLDEPRAPVAHVEAAGCPGAADPAWLAALRDGHARAPFDLARDLPLRVAVVRAAPGEHHLSIALHHVAADGRSIEILIDEFLRLYQAYSRGLPSPLPELPIQYGDHARREKARLSPERRERLLDFWAGALRGAPEQAALPRDLPRPAFNDFRGGRLWFHVPAETAAALRRLCLAEGVTPFMALLAAYKLLLHRRSGETDLVVGTPVSTRDWPDTEPLIGLFVNQLALRTDLSGNPSFRELLRRVRAGVLAAYQHRDLPFDELVAALRPRRTAAGHPLVQTLFAYSEHPWRGFALDGVETEFPEAHNGAAKYDLEVQVLGDGEAMRGYLEFNLGLFTPPAVQRLAREYVALLAAVADDPDLPAGPPPARTGAGEEAGAPATATRSPDA